MSTFTDGDQLKTKQQEEQERVIDVEEVARVRLQHSPYRAIRRITCAFDGACRDVSLQATGPSGRCGH